MGDVGEALADGEMLAVADALADLSADPLGDDDVARGDTDGKMPGWGVGTVPIGLPLRWSLLVACP